MRDWSHEVEVVDDKKGDGSSKHLADFEVSNKADKPRSMHGSSASSSSSDSIQGVDKPLEKSEQQPGFGSASPSQFSFVSSPTQSPRKQMPAGQAPEGHRPSRIPSSIFNSKPATPMDWSTASNESLFSIHVGNNSFSKDQFFMLYKSGELTKLDEQIIAQGLPHPSELDNMMMNENVEKSSASAATEMPKNAGEVAGKEHSQSKMAALPEKGHHPINNTTTVDLDEVSGNHIQEKKSQAKVPNSPTHSISGMSDDSTLSFVFPVLTPDGRPITANEDQNSKGLKTQQSAKQPEKELPPQTPVTPKNATGRSWFSWFSCCRCS